jgi:hypothetical protein
MGCAKEEPPPPPEAAETRAEAGPFSPPEDGLLTEEQVQSFLLAHEALLRINDLYLDSLLSAPPARQRALQQALDLGREVAARKFGLNGYAEYRWILEEAPRHPENVRMLERMRVTTLAP